jgi:hypothetical protein
MKLGSLCVLHHSSTKQKVSQQMGPKKHNTWKKDNVMCEIIAVRNKEMGLLRASKLFEVPKLTLKDKVKSKEQSIEKLVNIRNSRKSVLPEDLENALVSYRLIMEKQFFGLTTKDVKRMEFQLAIKNGIPHLFSGKDKKPDGNGFTILCADIRS